jgi:hypothetical protein
VCDVCDTREKKRIGGKAHGVYRMHCMMCCVSLVLSARPSRRQQEAMIQVIAPRWQSKDELLEALKTVSTKQETKRRIS